jgi:hypothetical protein
VQWRVAWVRCAARSAQAAGNLARDPPTNPRRSLFLACATSAGPGCAGWPRCAAITHRLPVSRPATPTKPVSPTLCGGPGDARWVHGRRPCLGRRQIGSKARGNTSSCINQVKSPDQEPGLTRLSTMQPAVVALLPGRALPHLGRCLRLQRPSHCRAITAIGTAAAVAALSLSAQVPGAARLFGVTGLSTHLPDPMDLIGPACVCNFLIPSPGPRQLASKSSLRVGAHWQ